MKLRLIMLFALLFILCTALQAQSKSVITKLNNGLTVIMVEEHSAELVGIDVWVKAGSSYETKDTNGITHLIEHLVYGATQTRSPGDMDIEMETLGSTLDANTSRDWTHYRTTVQSKNIDKALTIMADAMINATFPEKVVENEKLVLLDEIAKRNSDPISVCEDILNVQMYGGHTYSLPVEGVYESLKDLARQQLIQYYRKYFSPDNMAVVLVGDFKADNALKTIKDLFVWKTTNDKVLFSGQNPTPVKVEKTVESPWISSKYLAIGFMGPPAQKTADVCAVDVMMTYIGLGYRSWLDEELKNNLKLINQDSSDFLTHKLAGPINIIVELTDSDYAKAKTAIFAKIEELQKIGIPEDRIALAKRSLLGDFAFQKETYGGTANSYGFYFAISSPDFTEKYIDCVQSVSNEDIMRVAKEYLNIEKAAVIFITPAKKETK